MKELTYFISLLFVVCMLSCSQQQSSVARGWDYEEAPTANFVDDLHNNQTINENKALFETLIHAKFEELVEMIDIYADPTLASDFKSAVRENIAKLFVQPFGSSNVKIGNDVISVDAYLKQIQQNEGNLLSEISNVSLSQEIKEIADDSYHTSLRFSAINSELKKVIYSVDVHILSIVKQFGSEQRFCLGGTVWCN